MGSEKNMNEHYYGCTCAGCKPELYQRGDAQNSQTTTMAKIFVVGKQEWETNDRETGEKIQGLSYIGFLENGTPIKFTSREEYAVHTGEVMFDPARAIDIPLLTKLFGGKVGYQDGNSFGKN